MVVKHQMQIRPGGVCLSRAMRNFLNSSARWRRCSDPITFPDATSRTANKVVVTAGPRSRRGVGEDVHIDRGDGRVRSGDREMLRALPHSVHSCSGADKYDLF